MDPESIAAYFAEFESDDANNAGVAAALRAFVEAKAIHRTHGHGGGDEFCVYCSNYSNHPHKPDCLITLGKAALAKLQ